MTERWNIVNGHITIGYDSGERYTPPWTETQAQRERELRERGDEIEREIREWLKEEK